MTGSHSQILLTHQGCDYHNVKTLVTQNFVPFDDKDGKCVSVWITVLCDVNPNACAMVVY